MIKFILVFISACAKDEHHFMYVVYLVEVFVIFDVVVVVVVYRVIMSLFLKKTSSLLPSDASGMRFFSFFF